MKRSAFTMIELIFVIVILGILAAVSIPKLAATRDDAKISKMATNLNAVIQDLGSAYTSYGSLSTWIASTNVPLKLNATADVASTTAVTTSAYLYNDDKQCIKFTSTTDGNLTVENGSNTTDTVCAAVQSSQSQNIKSHVFGGSRVKY
jgi:general secretion pathway protein G